MNDVPQWARCNNCGDSDAGAFLQEINNIYANKGATIKEWACVLSTLAKQKQIDLPEAEISATIKEIFAAFGIHVSDRCVELNLSRAYKRRYTKGSP